MTRKDPDDRTQTDQTMETTLTILSDNCISGSGFIGEHGFSVLIERNGRRFLFDTGQGTALPMNLKTLQIGLKGLHRVIISRPMPKRASLIRDQDSAPL